MKPTALLLTLLATAVLVACGGSSGGGSSSGQSKQQKATSQVCNARDSIAKQVDTLKNLTPSTATTSQIKTSLTTIRNDLQKIASAQGDLNGQRKSQVQQANQQFKSELQGLASSLGTSTSVSQAKAQLTAALQQLATSYKKTFAKVDCSGS